MARPAANEVDELALSEAAELYLSLGRIMRALRRAGDAGSLSSGAGSALATLARSGPQRLGDLAAAERVTPPTMSRIVASLERSGHVMRTPDPNDKRASELSATEQGRSLVNGLTSERIQHLANVLDRLDPEQRDAAAAGLNALEIALDD
ncbi:MarR family winged helix-turn-helix transcriptional regulator [Antrihabitans cavernicola]|uniref:MarR family transcriptional regulator n=1 Tax=Antrihabitans cavernicola TaxID=2495913 RepID=A0A5A7SAC3_9NOCA|nr:MarR family transcriptional regulator [Spelaeibacter cavernicola]KAA0022132.1 MarR family transcriptional regulator [Spelaeibacter cavernicola]